jgi:hypothetical protein
MAAVGYNPDDPVQSTFLSALAQGETGNSTFSATEGFGGSNLAGAATDAFGFPQWTGLGNSHAAGTFQFQPATWDALAQQYGLNFANPADQSEGAWYLAQQVYAQKTGGGSLEDALSSGNPTALQGVQSALKGTWTSVVGNQANPQGLAAALAAPNATAGSTGGGIGAGSGSSASAAPASSGSSWLSNIPGVSWVTDQFQRGGLFIVGVLIILVAIWAILSNQGYVPSPRQLVRKIA